MTTEKVKLTDILNASSELITTIKKTLTENEIKFLISWKNKKPEWQLMGIAGIENLPGVRRRLMNLERMEVKKHAAAYKKLKEYLLGQMYSPFKEYNCIRSHKSLIDRYKRVVIGNLRWGTGYENGLKTKFLILIPSHFLVAESQGFEPRKDLHP